MVGVAGSKRLYNVDMNGFILLRYPETEGAGVDVTTEHANYQHVSVTHNLSL